MKEIYSIAEFSKRHIIGLTNGDPNNYAPFYELKIYGIPESFDDEKAEVIQNLLFLWEQYRDG